MEIKVQIPFGQLLDVVKILNTAQKARLRQELDEVTESRIGQADFIDYLLSGPVYSEEEINTIEDNRKSITAWRTN
jgi:hypothetical protein